jgi:cystathionine beta-lyase/cystathionine gamma-synthase
MAIGLTDSLVRISCGVEDPTDLANDVKQALDKAQILFDETH